MKGMKLTQQVTTAIFSAMSLLLVSPAMAQVDMTVCDYVWPEEPFVVSDQKQTVQLDEIGIQLDIPDNYRVREEAASYASVMSEPEYDYVQCMTENRVPTTPDVIDISFAKAEPLSEQQLLERLANDADSRVGIKRILGQTSVAGQRAFIYVQQGMNTDLVVRISYPDQEADLVVSTYLSNDGEVVLQQQLTEMLSTLAFL